ncbi:MAG: hypothetical protein ACUZ8E_05845 [Candidatus Anammoxibacter sp.]
MVAKGLFSFTARQLGFVARAAEMAVVDGKDLIADGARTVGRIRIKVRKPIDYLSELDEFSDTEIISEKRKKGDLVILNADEAKYILNRE